jgi:hypothetical protein
MPGPDQRDALNASPRSVADPVSEAARTSNTRGDADRAKPRPILRPALEMARCGFLCRFIRAEGDQSKASPAVSLSSLRNRVSFERFILSSPG